MSITHTINDQQRLCAGMQKPKNKKEETQTTYNI